MSLCAFIWFKNIEKMLLQMTSGFLQLESTIDLVGATKMGRRKSFREEKKGFVIVTCQ
jgi:hypothetical protein